jgi:hypothetical protein
MAAVNSQEPILISDGRPAGRAYELPNDPEPPMRLPHADRLEVPKAKIVDYLLSPTHPQGRHKATFFRAFGFTLAAWEQLAAALRRHGAENEVAAVEDTPFGRRYSVDGELAGADGRRPRLRTVWFVAPGQEMPRFVTAHPTARKVR